MHGHVILMRPRPSRISVIIPALNAARTIASQLGALSSQSYEGEFEVIVADNGSVDSTRDISLGYKGRLPDLRIVDASQRRSANFARNAGAAAARGDLLAYCDADDVANAGWLDALAEGARAFDVVGGATDHKLLNDEVVQAWRRPSQVDRLAGSDWFLPYAVGGNLAIWSDVLETVGGWNDDYVLGATEVELCWRLQLASYKIGFVPAAVMHRRYRDSLKQLWRQGFRLGRANVMLYRDFRHAGVSRDSVRSVAKMWARLIIMFPRVARSRKARGRWMFTAAHRTGQLWGTLRYRTLML